MKQYIAFICAILLLLLCSCQHQTPHAEMPADNPPSSEQENVKGENTPPKEEKNPIQTMEKLAEVDGVISVTKQTFSRDIKDAVAYKVLYESEHGKLSADVVLPDDYAKENKNATVLIYFPEVGTFIETLASNYAQNDVIVIRPYSRGHDESEGMRDVGGARDLADAQTLLKIFDSASFIENSKIFVAGSGEGSVNALRLFAEDSEKRISGCAVIDGITDLPAYCDFRGDGVKNLFGALIGKTVEEAPEEYAMRSAVTFAEKLDRPVLLLHYTQTPLFTVEQTDALYALLQDRNDACTYHKINALSSDFYGEGLQRLLSWMNQYD